MAREPAGHGLCSASAMNQSEVLAPRDPEWWTDEHTSSWERARHALHLGRGDRVRVHVHDTAERGRKRVGHEREVKRAHELQRCHQKRQERPKPQKWNRRRSAAIRFAGVEREHTHRGGRCS